MNREQKHLHAVAQAVFALFYLLSLSTPALAQANTKPAVEKWRPKDGPYASPGKLFDDICGEYGDIIIDLAERSVSGQEWSCKITKLTEMALDTIRMSLTCSNQEKHFKETLTLKKLGERSMSVGFKGAGSNRQADYCPEKWQRSYMESRAQARAEAEKKARK